MPPVAAGWPGKLTPALVPPDGVVAPVVEPEAFCDLVVVWVELVVVGVVLVVAFALVAFGGDVIPEETFRDMAEKAEAAKLALACAFEAILFTFLPYWL